MLDKGTKEGRAILGLIRRGMSRGEQVMGNTEARCSELGASLGSLPWNERLTRCELSRGTRRISGAQTPDLEWKDSEPQAVGFQTPSGSP